MTEQNIYDVEYTDTLDGEANYSWVGAASSSSNAGINALRLHRKHGRELQQGQRDLQSRSNERGKSRDGINQCSRKSRAFWGYDRISAIRLLHGNVHTLSLLKHR